MTSEMSAFAVLEEPSFTLPARPGLLAAEPVDLLADSDPRRLPEGAVSGFAVIGGLVAFSCLVGGLTAGLVVIGVSTLLAAIAAIVRGQVSLSAVGGQRGAALLLGAAVTALIVPSVTAHERRPAADMAGGVPVSSPFAVGTQTAYAAVPASGDTTGSATHPGASSSPSAGASAGPVAPHVATPSVQAPSATLSAVSDVTGLTLSLDALSPKSAASDGKGEKVGHQVDDVKATSKHSGANAGKSGGKNADKSSGKGTDKVIDRATDKTSEKAPDKAAQKAADKAAKAAEKAAKAAAAHARESRAVVQGATKGATDATSPVRGASSAASSKALLSSVKKAEKVAVTRVAKAESTVAALAVKAQAKAEKKAATKAAKATVKAAKTAAKSGTPAASGR
ncbi:hypothetical protein [Terrabacter terrigena]|uniref:Uncharacterized protein n=1 Tax=Terrabacter terrigena TaxID=574718 RepID=A0ABW3MZU4_9MICO